MVTRKATKLCLLSCTNFLPRFRRHFLSTSTLRAKTSGLVETIPSGRRVETAHQPMIGLVKTRKHLKFGSYHVYVVLYAEK